MENKERNLEELLKLTEILKALGFEEVDGKPWRFCHFNFDDIEIDFSAVALEPHSVMYQVINTYSEYFYAQGKTDTQKEIQKVLGIIPD